MTRGASRRAVAALAVVAAVLTAAPAGGIGPGGTEDAQARIAQSGEVLAESGSAKFRGTTTAPGGGAGSKVRFNGVFDFESRAGEYTVAASALGLPGEGKVRALLVDGVLYMSLNAVYPGASASMPELEGKKWLKLDPAIFGGEGQIGQSDPTGGLSALRGAASDVQNVGAEKVRGTRTTHYRVTIDVEQAVANAPAEEQEQVRARIAALGAGTIPADVWIDSKDRLRKVRLRVGGAATRGGAVAFEYFDLGARVNVKQPPAEEVVDFFDLLGGETTPLTS